MALTNQQKQEIARQFVSAPVHYVHHDNTRINDSRLCYFNDESEDFIIGVKFVDRGQTRPCIGFYWFSRTKRKHIPSIERIRPVPGFYLVTVEGNRGGLDNGWVEFCHDQCGKADGMYSEIVNPGTFAQQWLAMFETLKKWAEDELGITPRFYDEECTTNTFGHGWEV